MSVTRDYSIQNIENKDTFATAPTDYSGFSSGAVQGGNALLGGAISRTSTSSGRVATVKAGEDIRPALESLRSAGGGTLLFLAGTHRPTYDIVGGSKINIIGEGIDQTVIDFGSAAYQLRFVGTSGVNLKNFKIAGLTITGSTDTSALIIDNARDFIVEDILVTANTGDGCYLARSSYFSFKNSRFESNGDNGLKFDSDFSIESIAWLFDKCIFSENTDSGIYFTPVYGTIKRGALIGCTADMNGVNGYTLESNPSYSSFLGCTATENVVSGFDFGVNSTTLLGCVANSNDHGLKIANAASSLTGSSMIGCNFFSNTTNQVWVEDKDWAVTLIGNYISNQTYDTKASKISSSQNSGQLFLARQEFILAKNTSGGARAVGDVCVMKVTATDIEATTTTTLGDKFVLGIHCEAVSSNAYADVQILGHTASLKVNGTTDIAIGDYLSTYSVAGIAGKASAGHMVFAIAMEAYTNNDSNGVIDAILISPRLI